MVSLYILRHAKSDWKSLSGGDHARPLSSRGRRAAGEIGRFLKRIDEVPDRVLVSTATRTQETLQLAQEAGEWEAPTHPLEALYESSPIRVVDCIREYGQTAPRLLLVSHQPTAADLAALLIGGGRVQMVTAALVRIDLPFEGWADLESHRGQLTWMVTPRMLESLLACPTDSPSPGA
ncbi:MAG: histidine phosphatase family protein [Thermoanaerobaculia bacterium]|nr:histidine phosphatase family protein [Thermoanaerobaculia bacterium]